MSKRTTVGRSVLGTAMVAVLALVLVACGGDDEADETTTTTEATDETTTTTAAPLSDEEFQAQVDPILADLAAAGTDLCKVIEAASASGPAAEASTEAQVKLTVEAQVAILRAIAATEPVDQANAATINGVADDLAAAAEADGYSTDFLQSEEFAAVVNDEQLVAALSPYQTRAASECAPTGADGATGDQTTTSVAG
jgi:hypothetical protein